MAAAGISKLNALSTTDAMQALMKCCGSTRWSQAMIARRPFAHEAELTRIAREIWNGLTKADFLEAFSHHPRIGDRVRAGGWESHEQSGTHSAAATTLGELRRLNGEYEVKFGHVFLICATGKSADEMLAQLKVRIALSAEEELRNAALEQGLITQLRLKKMLTELASGETS